MSTIQIRIWEEEKAAAQELFAKFWMNLSTAVKAFLNTSLAINAPALTFSKPVKLTKNWFTEAFEKRMVKETERAKKYWKVYTWTTEEMFEDILWPNWR